MSADKRFFKPKKNLNIPSNRIDFPKFNIVGTFTGYNVEIHDVEHMHILYSQGCYGKGNLSRSAPNFKLAAIVPNETANLMLEEAFFLSYVVGCLQVKFNNVFLNLDEMWNLFQRTATSFIPRYISYHHFRMAGWVVRSGIKFGSDFMLYKQGPEYYHASYSVQVSDLSMPACYANHKWVQLATINRITESAAKELLICNVVTNQQAVNCDLTSPKCIENFHLNLIVFKRWVSAQERIS